MDMPSGGRADASSAGNHKSISPTPFATVSEAETTLGTALHESSPEHERGPRLNDKAMAGTHGTIWARIAATWTLCAWLGYLPGFGAPVSLTGRRTCPRDILDFLEAQQGQSNQEGTLIERLTATWVLFKWLGYLPAVDMGFQDDTTSDRITLRERATATWSLIMRRSPVAHAS